MQLNSLNLKFHHTGYVCKNIYNYKKMFYPFIVNKKEIIFEDFNQNVKVEFIETIDGIKIELLEVLNDKIYCPIKKFIERNGSGYHHVCFETDKIERTLNELKKNNFRMITQIKKGFEKRDICFVVPKYNPEGPLIEIVSKIEE